MLRSIATSRSAPTVLPSEGVRLAAQFANGNAEALAPEATGAGRREREGDRRLQKMKSKTPITTSRPIRKMIPMIHASTLSIT